jgi:hypothetical protein
MAFAGTLLATASLAQAAITDITIFDGLLADSPSGSSGSNGLFGGSTDPRFAGQPKMGEFNEVENGNIEHASWDLRAFGFDPVTKKLIYQGGMNIASEHVNDAQSSTSSVNATTQLHSQYFGIGSIFLKLGTDDGSSAAYEPPIWSNNSTSPSTNGNYGFLTNGELGGGGFDYAITLRTGATGTLDYVIYELNEDSVLRMPWYGANDEAGPYAYLPEDNTTNSIAVAQQNTGVSLKTAAQMDGAAYGGLQSFGVSSYVAEFNLDGIGITNGSYFYLTQECGNDSLVGQYSGPNLVIIPEPSGTAALIGLLLGGAFFRTRRPTAG